MPGRCIAQVGELILGVTGECPGIAVKLACLANQIERDVSERQLLFECRRLAGDPIPLAELAVEFGVSRERVRQIEVRAFEKVQKAVKNRIALLEASACLPVQI